jgi:hypothetical protein
MPERFADCKIMAPETVLNIDDEIADGVRKVKRDPNKVVIVLIRVEIRHNKQLNEPVPEYGIKSISDFIRRRCAGFVRGSQLVLRGTGVLSDMDPVSYGGESDAEREAS